MLLPDQEPKTVFILGAGASIPFGYPSGETLVEMITNSLMPDYKYEGVRKNVNISGNVFDEKVTQTFLDYDVYLKNGFSKNDISSFRFCLLGSYKSSIDNFLVSRPEFLEIGKFAIANSLLKFENESNLYFNRSNWLRYLWNKVNTLKSSFTEKRIAFLIFNYDRVIENFFYRAFSASYKYDIKGAAAATCRSIPIIHLHGTLGFPPWELGASNYNYDPNSFETHFQKVKEASKNIKIIYDEIDADSFNTAKSFIKNAKKVFMIGLGFHALNTERLGIKTL